jgi:hypothetical protein
LKFFDFWKEKNAPPFGERIFRIFRILKISWNALQIEIIFMEHIESINSPLTSYE